MSRSKELGVEPISRLLVKMSVPAAIGILTMSINFIVDTIFVGRFVGALGIAAITVVLPISFLISSIGMAIGIGGSSIISRALGAGARDKAARTLGVMAVMTLSLSVALMLAGFLFSDFFVQLFGGKGDILAPAREYFSIILMCVPALAWAMMSNNVMRAEGKPRLAMLAMLLPALSNIALDVLFIVILDWGLRGAAWATAGAYTLGGLYGLWFFLLGPGEVRLLSRNLRWDYPLVREISSIGVVTLARQGAVSLLTIVLNHTLFSYGDELAIAIYGVINRIMMFANFPVLGITQGFLPIAGYNFGARQWKRVSEVIRASVLAGTGIAVALLVVIVAFAPVLVGLFTTDPELLNPTPRALKIVFGAMPLIPAQLIGSAYFQANGKALPALLLTLTKQGFFLVPLVLVLPLWLGLDGVWIAFPLADVLAASVTLLYLRREIRVHLLPAIQEEEAMQVAKRQQEALALSRGKKIS